jgi:hypothetical protein
VIFGTAGVGAVGRYVLTAADAEGMNQIGLTNQILGEPVVEGQVCVGLIVKANGDGWNILVVPDGALAWWIPNVALGTGEGLLELLTLS